MLDAAIAQGHNGREAAVRQRYSAAAKAREEALCCPVNYTQEYLEVIPPEVLERDYDCGDPTPYGMWHLLLTSFAGFRSVESVEILT